MELLGIVGLLVLACGFFYLRRRAMGRVARGQPAPFHSVMIQAGAQCCDAVQPFTQRRMLAGEAPKLPLADCIAPECRCKYVHFDDRREQERRGSGGPRVGNPRTVDWMQRRRNRGRRKADRLRVLDEAEMRAAIAERRRRRARGERNSPLV